MYVPDSKPFSHCQNTCSLVRNYKHFPDPRKQFSVVLSVSSYYDTTLSSPTHYPIHLFKRLRHIESRFRERDLSHCRNSPALVRVLITLMCAVSPTNKWKDVTLCLIAAIWLSWPNSRNDFKDWTRHTNEFVRWDKWKLVWLGQSGRTCICLPPKWI